MIENKQNVISNAELVFKDIINEFAHIPQENSWWLLITFYLAKERRLSIENNDIHVSYLNSCGLENIVKAVCPIYPKVKYWRDNLSGEGLSMYNNTLVQIVHKLISLDETWYSANFNDIYNRILERITANEGRSSSEYVQPKELTSLAVKMLQYESGSIYNPFAGLCSYAVALKGVNDFIAQELSVYTFNLARLNLLANGLDGVDLRQENSFHEFLQADYIIATPPYCIKVNELPYHSSDAFILEKIAHCSYKRGVVILPYFDLFGGSDELPLVRKELVDTDLIDTIITLPESLMTSNKIPMVMVVTCKNKQRKGIVRMINFSHCYIPERGGNHLDLEKVDQILSDTQSRYVNFVSKAEIAQNDYDLRYCRYWTTDVEIPQGYQLKELSDLVTQNPLRKASKEDDLPILFINDPELTGATLSASDGKRRDHRMIFSIVEDDTMVITASQKGVSSVWFDSSQGAALVLRSSVFGFSTKDASVDKNYLMMELAKKYVMEQLGVGQPIYPADDILRLKILVPTLDTQRDIVIEAQKEYILKRGILLQDLQSKQYQDFYRAMRTRKHAIGQVINQVLPGINTIVNFVNKHDYKEDVVGIRTGKTLGEYVTALQHNIIRIGQMVGQFTKEIEFPEAETLCFEDVISAFITDHLSEGYTIELDVANNEKHSVKIAKSSLIQILDNICSNALGSGFKDVQMLLNGTYRIRISCDIDSTDPSKLQILVANNGEPLSPKISNESVFAWGEGERTGIGGFEIAMIVKHYGGYAKIHRYENDAAGFTVGYEIVLPLANCEEYE